MVAKTTKIVLECPAWDMTQELEISHAERLLRMKNNGGWQIPTNSPYEFVDNGIRSKQDKKGNNGAKEPGDYK